MDNHNQSGSSVGPTERSPGIAPDLAMDQPSFVAAQFDRALALHALAMVNTCRECGYRERPGELRHSFIHTQARQLANAKFRDAFARGPFYAAQAAAPHNQVVRSAPSRRSPAHRRRPTGRSVALKVGSGIFGAALVGGGAFGVTNWVIGLNSGSSGEGQAASVTNLTISAVSSPSATNLLFPGANGDVVLTITNPNVFPVTVTGVDLPTNTTYATGYSAAGLTGAISGCSAANSDVFWNYSTATNGSVHTLASPLTIGAASSLTVTLTNDASMTTAAPAACEAAYFSMPSLTGVVATGGSATATTSPTADAWTS